MGSAGRLEAKGGVETQRQSPSRIPSGSGEVSPCSIMTFN